MYRFIVLQFLYTPGSFSANVAKFSDPVITRIKSHHKYLSVYRKNATLSSLKHNTSIILIINFGDFTNSLSIKSQNLDNPF